MKSSGIGGQAVIEGVMMKNKDTYAVAVRKPDNEITVEKKKYVSASEKYKLLKLPIFRGVLAFAESMIIGMKTLTFSAGFFEEEEEAKPNKVETAFSKLFKEKAESVVMGITVLLSIVMAVAIFMMLPYFAAEFFQKHIDSPVLLALIEGLIRIVIFIAYVAAISQMKDIKRVFMYHGAEHKTINCLERGFELTVKNVRFQSKEHKRCGTSFMLIVMVVSILFFIFIRVDTPWLRIVIRLLLIPVIAGVAYEFIRLAGKSESKIVNVLSKPGLWLQALTTREPDDEMIEVAIQSVEAVFDWRDYLEENQIEVSRETAKKKNEKREEKRETVELTAVSKSDEQKEAYYGKNRNKGNSTRKKNNKIENREELKKQEEHIAAAFDMADYTEDAEEEDDVILRALDRYFTTNQKEDQDKE